MHNLTSGQFSLGALLGVVTLCCVMFGLARLVPWPELGAVDPMIWGVVLLAGCAMLIVG